MKRAAVLAFLAASFLLPGAGAAGTAPEPSRKDRIAALPEEERKWLTEFVAPIIQPEEEALYLQLTEPHQREIFKEAFWARREKANLVPPLGPGFRYRYQEVRELADTKYDGWRNDAGRMVIARGEPNEIETMTSCGDTLRDLEFWKYSNLGGSGRGKAEFLFYRPSPGTPRKLWYVGIPEEQLYTPASRPLTPQEQAIECTNGPKPLSASLPRPNHECICRLFEFMQQAKAASPASGMMEAGRALTPDKISTEDLSQIAGNFPDIPTKGAKSLGVEGPSSSAPAGAPAKPAVQTASSTPAPTHRKLSKKEVKELTARLAQKYRDFLELVDLIITDDEREIFVQIADDYQKDRFIESFWRRVLCPGYPKTDGWTRRIFSPLFSREYRTGSRRYTRHTAPALPKNPALSIRFFPCPRSRQWHAGPG
jgi:GWxTD domain-containing protein